MPRICFNVAYDGRPYEGWQSQPSGETVQDYLERALGEILQRDIRIHGSGRTDSGVHAMEQVFHIEMDEIPSIPINKWHLAMNAKLPHTIRILGAREVADDFHARFSAKGKVYRYTISQSQILSPFEYGLVWHNPKSLDADLMQKAMGLIKGEHDFRAFAALRGNEPNPIPEDYFVRTIYEASLQVDGDLVHLTYQGNGFMYKMVRLLTGAIHTVGTGKLALDDFAVLLTKPVNGKSPYCAPAEGLYLMNVVY